MKHIIKYMLQVAVISGLSSAKDICQKVMDGVEGPGVPIEEINQCYECNGWSEVTEGKVLIPSLDADATGGWSWCAESPEDAFEVRYRRPKKLGGFTITPLLPNAWVKEMSLSYEDDNNEISEIRNISGHTVFQGNVDDYSMKENRFLLPITATNIRIRILSNESASCFNIRLYSCDRIVGSTSGHRYGGQNAPLSDASAGNTDDCEIDGATDCDIKCFRYLTDSDGCDRCACDETFSGTIEGDIIIDSSSRYMIETEYGIRKDSENIQRAGIKGERYRWKDHRSGNNYVVPYTLDGSLTSRGRSVISQAMQGIERASCIQFRQRTNQQNYLRFVRKGGCYSYVGNIRRGPQEVSIGNGCEYVGIVQHEVLHALGFWHEQSRSDRDRYINIFYQNIQKGRENNFEKRNHQDYGSPYDYKSVMHYSNRAFSSNGKATIQAKGNPDLSLGQRDGLSKEDRNELNRMYQCRGTGTTTTGRTTTMTTSTIKVTTTTMPSTCTNKVGDRTCDYWKGRGFCRRKYVVYMTKNCAKSCGKCGGGGNCKDLKSNCWRQKRHCTRGSRKRRARILKQCPKTCNQC